MQKVVYILGTFFGCALLLSLYCAMGFWGVLVAIAPLSHGGLAMIGDWLAFWYVANGLVVIASLVAVWDVVKRGEFLQTSLRLAIFFSILLVLGYCFNLFVVR